MDIMNVHPLLGRLEAKFVTGAMGVTTAHSTTRHPHQETVRIVITTRAVLAHWRATEFTTPNDKRILEPILAASSLP